MFASATTLQNILNMNSYLTLGWDVKDVEDHFMNILGMFGKYLQQYILMNTACDFSNAFISK